MLNLINSYSNYDSYTKNNNIQTRDVSLNYLTNSTPQIVVKDKSEATSQILGYGVDSEGFFTSDFNEKAQISSHYRIYAKGVENFVNQQTMQSSMFTMYTQIDIAKSFGNIYKVFSQLAPNTENSTFSKDEISNLPIAFSLDKDFNIKQTYTYAEYQNLNDTQRSNIFTSFDIFSVSSYTNNANNIFESKLGANIGANVYQNTDGSVDKGGVLMAFASNFLFGATKRLLVGETNISGKLAGLDKTITQREIDEFKAFMNTNKIKSAFNGSHSEWNFIEDKFSLSLYVKDSVENKLGAELVSTARQLQKEYDELISSNLSLDEFKQKYLDFKARHDDFIKQFDEAMSKVALNDTQNNDINFSKNTKSKDNSNKSSNQISKRTPIQVISKDQTYKDLNFSNIQNLLKDKHEIQLFELLFSQKTDKTNHSSQDFINFNLKQFNQMKNLNSIDIKA